MSASERLRALDAAATAGPWYDDCHYPENVWSGCPTDHWDYYLDQSDSDLIVALRNALPLIADVVEAAEQECDWGGCHVCGYYGPKGHLDDCALTALQEHLEGGA